MSSAIAATCQSSGSRCDFTHSTCSGLRMLNSSNGNFMCRTLPEGFCAICPESTWGPGQSPDGGSRSHGRVCQPQRHSALVCDDLLERLAEIELEIVPFGPAEMGRAQDVGHRQERMISAGDRLLLVDIDRGKAR